MRIPITKPVIDNCEKKNIIRPLTSGWLVQGKFVKEFEKRFAVFTKAKFAIAVTSCTTALHLALECLGIKPGDRVIVPSFTFIATANAVEYTGAEVVFCDIDLQTFNLDPGRLEEILRQDKNRKIKAVIPVHLFGLCAEMDKILKIARKYHLQVVEDAACGFGAWIGRKHAGTFGDAGCFSFHPRKLITTGEGGMLITYNEALAKKALSLRDHGASKSDLQRHLEKGGSLLPEYDLRGFNYRMTDLQGAIGVCQMKKARMIMSQRRVIVEKYDRALKEEKNLIRPVIKKNYVHGYQSYVCLFTGGASLVSLLNSSLPQINKLNRIRNRIMSALEEQGISTRQGTHAVHTLGYYRHKYKLKDEDYFSSYAADRLSIALPLYAEMTPKEFNWVIQTLKNALGK